MFSVASVNTNKEHAKPGPIIVEQAIHLLLLDDALFYSCGSYVVLLVLVLLSIQPIVLLVNVGINSIPRGYPLKVTVFH
jgi:ABC-type proline/glycine betaine transport system permease subunit